MAAESSHFISCFCVLSPSPQHTGDVQPKDKSLPGSSAARIFSGSHCRQGHLKPLLWISGEGDGGGTPAISGATYSIHSPICLLTNHAFPNLQGLHQRRKQEGWRESQRSPVCKIQALPPKAPWDIKCIYYEPIFCHSTVCFPICPPLSFFLPPLSLPMYLELLPFCFALSVSKSCSHLGLLP